MVAEPRVIKRGNLEGAAPEVMFVAQEYYGRHDTNMAAKRAFVVALEPEFAKCDDNLVKRQFRALSCNLGQAKIMRCHD